MCIPAVFNYVLFLLVRPQEMRDMSPDQEEGYHDSQRGECSGEDEAESMECEATVGEQWHLMD
jgi:hypothetical protein